MRRFFSYIIGNTTDFSLRYRMANTILIISALFGLQATIANFMLGLPILTIYGSAFFGIILVGLYYISRFKNKLEISIIIALLIAIFFYVPVMWIGNAGSKGGAVFYIFLYGAFIISLLKGFKAWLFVFLLTFVSITMLLLEYNNQITIYQYKTDFDRIFDLAVSFVFVIFGVTIIIYIYTQQFYRSNSLLSEKNDELEQTNEKIMLQKTEIETQRDEIETQRDAVIKQKEKVEEIHQSLSDSIDYAKRIQDSILPDINILKQFIDDFFVLFKPRDIVSGDFYWFTKKDEYSIIAIADCTGHGVPGAFMSVLGCSLLHDIIEKERCEKPDKILDKLREEVIISLNQKEEIGGQRDGMDISLIRINNKTKLVEFSGANNPLYIIKNGELKIENENSSAVKLYEYDEFSNLKLYEVKPDKMPIAIYNKMFNFNSKAIQLEKGDKIYMFTDGYADQFGGTKGRKFMQKRFKQVLLQNADKPMHEQKEILENTLNNWKLDFDQIDDILVLGVRL